MEKPTSPPSLEALLSNPSLFEELSFEGPDEKVLSSLGVMYGGEEVKGVQKLLKNATSFKMATTVNPFYFIIIIFFSIYMDSSSFAYTFLSSVQMSVFGAYMTKYRDRRQHQFSFLSDLREGAQVLYSEV